jgi:hypothetical protein
VGRPQKTNKVKRLVNFLRWAVLQAACGSAAARLLTCARARLAVHSLLKLRGGLFRPVDRRIQNGQGG